MKSTTRAGMIPRVSEHGMYSEARTVVTRPKQSDMPVTLLLLIAAMGVSGAEAAVPAPAPGELLLRKCCPAHQQLSGALDACVEVSDGPPLWDASTVEDASALLELSAGGVPWWLDGDLLLLEADGSPPAAAGPFLAGQPAGARVGYGAHPICARFDRLFVPTFARDRVALLRDGRLRLALRGGGDPGRFVLLPPEDYCVDRVAAPPTPKRPNTFVAMACPCARAVCVRKCCANSQVYAATNWRKSVELTCAARARTDAAWSPAAWEGDAEGYLLLAGTGLSCAAGERPALLTAEPPPAGAAPAGFRLLRNGSAVADDYLRAGPLRRFCAERVRFGDRLVEDLHVCLPLAAAAAGGGAASLGARQGVYAALLGVGAACLLATLLVYALLPDLRRSAHAKALVGHVAALLVGSVAQAAGQLRAALPDAQCHALAFIVQFSFLAAFFWLNAMCIDIAWAFSGYRAMQGSISERDRRKFLYYSAYAWGSPAVISAVTALLEFAQGLPEHLLRPNFGKRTCWFYSKMATLAYFYGPMAALLLANVALFAYTTARIVRVQRETAVLSGGDSGRHDGGGGGAAGGGSALRGDRKRLMLYLKLFCLMGVTWITEIISWAEGSDGVYWYVTDAINLLRGLFIFVLFCCKPKVLKLLRRRVRELWLCAGGCWRSDGAGGGGRGPGAGRSSTLWSLVRASQKGWGRGGGRGGATVLSSSATSASTLHTTLPLSVLSTDAPATTPATTSPAPAPAPAAAAALVPPRPAAADAGAPPAAPAPSNENGSSP